MLRAKSDRRNNIKSPISAPLIAFRPRTLAITAPTMRRPPSIRAIPPATDAISAPTIQRNPPIRVIPAVTRPTTPSTLHFPSRTIATIAAAFANRGARCRAGRLSETKTRSTIASTAPTRAIPTPTPTCTGPTIDFSAPTLRIPRTTIDSYPPTTTTNAPIRQTTTRIIENPTFNTQPSRRQRSTTADPT